MQLQQLKENEQYVVKESQFGRERKVESESGGYEIHERLLFDSLVFGERSQSETRIILARNILAPNYCDSFLLEKHLCFRVLSLN